MFILNPRHKRRKHRKCACRRRRHIRRGSGKRVIRFHGRRIGWMTLVKMKGVRGAKRVWRSAKKLLAGK